MIKVFNADDHPILRKGVTDLLVQTDDIEWLGSAGDGQESLVKIRALKPDIAILDIEMPHYTGLDVARILIDEKVDTKFILLTLFKDESFFKSALAMGIMGYLLKESSENEIIDCIRSVHSGRPYVNPSLTYLLIKAESNSTLDKLSDKEVNILKLIARQKTSAEIGDMLFISPKTVTNHRNNISKKLDLDGKQNALLKWAMENKNLLVN
tara:strand:+ start:2369 stop:2998 length:630 start_codon:yes stop_codon:yes gene_type:complete